VGTAHPTRLDHVNITMTNLNQKIQALKPKVYAAFDDTRFPGQSNLVDKRGCDDSEVRDFYQFAEWQSIPDNAIAFNNASLSFFSPEAYQFYLPRYLIYSLDNYTSGEIVIDNTIYSLAPQMKCNMEDIKKYLSDHGNVIGLQERKILKDIIMHFETSENDDSIEFSISKYRCLNEEQKSLIYLILRFINDHLLEYFDEEAVKSALDYWCNEIK